MAKRIEDIPFYGRFSDDSLHLQSLTSHLPSILHNGCPAVTDGLRDVVERCYETLGIDPNTYMTPRAFCILAVYRYPGQLSIAI